MENKKKRLTYLKARLRTKLNALEYQEVRIAPYAEIFAYLNKLAIPFTIVDLLGYLPEWQPFLESELQKPIYLNLNQNIGCSEGEKICDSIFTAYPSVHPLRYVPESFIPIESNTNIGLTETVEFLGLKNQSVYLYHLQYAPILKLQLFDLLEAESDEIFNFWHGDAVISPIDYSWLIAFSLEEQWYAVEYK